MKSDVPKVLHLAAGRPLLAHVLGAVAPLGPARTVVVVPKDHDEIAATMNAAGFDDVEYAVQDEPRGTGDAARLGMQALDRVDGVVLVLPGDHPLLQPKTLRSLVSLHVREGAAATVLTAHTEDIEGRGRIVRDAAGDLVRIVEHRDATETERAITEFNAGIYAFDASKLTRALDKVDAENAQGEYYLTDVIELLRNDGDRVLAHLTDSYDALGVNSRVQLAQAGKLVRRRAAERLLDEGVTIVDLDSTFIDPDVKVGRDAVIHPFTFLEGDTTIGTRCEIGPNVRMIDSTVGDRAKVAFAIVRGSEIGANATVGPFASLRPGTKLEPGAHVGSFVEIKQSTVGERSKVPHLSYIGDAEIGRDVNIGAGTITCNWDGQQKNRTVIGDEAYISSDTMLVAPVEIGRRAATGAGAVVRGDVPDDALAVGMPARILQGKGDRMKKRKKSAEEPDITPEERRQ